MIKSLPETRLAFFEFVKSEDTMGGHRSLGRNARYQIPVAVGQRLAILGLPDRQNAHMACFERQWHPKKAIGN